MNKDPYDYYFTRVIPSLMPLSSTPSAVHLPAYLLQNSERFKFLLPGGCMREEA